MIEAILLDIEGTTTPIDFVHKTLFPYAKKRMGKFVEMHFDAFRDEIAGLVDEHAHDASTTLPLDPLEPGSVSVYLEHLIDVDRKSTPLKAIQGKIWQEGYESGELTSVIFDDVQPAFSSWNAAGYRIAIYSSGSTLAQKLLFRHTNHGDMTPFISAYFDTTTGTKRDAATYRRISEALGKSPEQILFLSDVTGELNAARSAGISTCLMIRPGNERHEACDHASASDLAQIPA